MAQVDADIGGLLIHWDGCPHAVKCGETSSVHRDQKIGLSLAVLLIGFAGAFCFRHEPIIYPQSVALDHADELDLRIEHLPIRAYTEREGVHVPGVSPAQTTRVAADGPLSDVLVAPLAVTVGDDDQIDLFAGPPEPLRVFSPPPPVIRRRPSLKTAPPKAAPPNTSLTVQIPQTNVRAIPSASTESSSVMDTHENSEPAPDELDKQRNTTSRPEMKTYVVQPGDTLSGIAERFLGSMVRYQELFEANRDVLENPNSLRTGVVLQIPVESRESEDRVDERSRSGGAQGDQDSD